MLQCVPVKAEHKLAIATGIAVPVLLAFGGWYMTFWAHTHPVPAPTPSSTARQAAPPSDPNTNATAPVPNSNRAQSRGNAVAGNGNSVGNVTGGDNSTNIGGGSHVEQHSAGPCSPNIVGNGNTTNCTPMTRVLSAESLKAFTDVLGQVRPGMLRVIIQSTATDAFPLGSQICNAAAALPSWGTMCPQSRQPDNPVLVQGLECYAANWDEADAAAFKSAMAAASLSCAYKTGAFKAGERGGYIGGNGATLVVGDPAQ
jgi:hypothetical protein